MKNYFHPAYFALLLGIFVFSLPILERNYHKEGIPLYEIQEDGTQKLIRVIPIDESYINQQEITKTSEAILAKKV